MAVFVSLLTVLFCLTVFHFFLDNVIFHPYADNICFHSSPGNWSDHHHFSPDCSSVPFTSPNNEWFSLAQQLLLFSDYSCFLCLSGNNSFSLFTRQQLLFLTNQNMFVYLSPPAVFSLITRQCLNFVTTQTTSVKLFLLGRGLFYFFSDNILFILS